MYKSFRVSNFRCFQELTLDSLERVNLVGGANNVGKTALLEALFVHCGRYSPELALRVNAFRGIEFVSLRPDASREAPWDSLFADFDTMKEIEIVGEMEPAGRELVFLKALREPEDLAGISKFEQHEAAEAPAKPENVMPSSGFARVLELRYEGSQRKGRNLMILDHKGVHLEPVPPPPPFPAFFHPARTRVPAKDQVQRFSNLQKSGKSDVLLKVLGLIEPRLSRVEILSDASEPVLHGHIGASRPIPLSAMGGGMVRLTDLVLHIGNAENGVALVDEIENGLHHSVLRKVWQAVGEMAREFNTQVFATTHSFECIEAAHKAFEESESHSFRFLRLERIKGTIRAVTYDRETLAAAIETGMEVR